MQFDRAKEILNSSDNINVTYHNSPVWIESLQGDDSSAFVTLIGTERSMTVPVTELAEQR